MKHYKLIIFDLDDTLFDYEETEKYAIFKSCENLGITFCGDLYATYKKANNSIRKEYGLLTSINIQQFRYARVKKFFHLINNSKINPNDFIKQYLENSTVGILIEGVQETLEKLKGVFKIVATNGSNYPRQNKLEGSAIAKYIDAYYSSETLGVAKPNSEFFLKIMKKYDVMKNKVLSVGDNYATDVQCAIELGIDGCWFNYRLKTQTFALPKNVYIIEKFNKLINIVKGD